VGVDAQLLLVASPSGMGRECFGVVVDSGRSVTTTSLDVGGFFVHVSLILGL
jgi:hypothetical protein